MGHSYVFTLISKLRRFLVLATLFCQPTSLVTVGYQWILMLRLLFNHSFEAAMHMGNGTVLRPHAQPSLKYCPRGVHGLKPYVNDKQFDRLINFPYMKTEAEVQDFGSWIEALGIKEVHGMFHGCVILFHISYVQVLQIGGRTRSTTNGFCHHSSNVFRK
jgi:hypothetical protein